MSSNAKKSWEEVDLVKQRPNHAAILEAANLIISIIKTPANFLKFLSDAASWPPYVEDKEARTSALFLTQLLTEEIAIPWVEAKGEDLKAVSEGIAGLFDTFGAKEYCDHLAYLMKAYVDEFLLKNHPGGDWMATVNRGFYAISSIYPALNSLADFESLIKIEAQK